MFNIFNSIQNKYNDYNNLRILDIIVNSNNQIGGGVLTDLFKGLKLIIGIILLIIGIILICIKNSWISTNARIINHSNDDNNYKITLFYEVDGNKYTKLITKSINNINDDTITIYYDENNPNIIRLYNFNYMVAGIIIISLSLLFLLNIDYSNKNLNNNLNNKNLYDSSNSNNNFHLIYSFPKN